MPFQDSRHPLLQIVSTAGEDLADRLAAIPGVVEHGLFIGIAKAVISAGPAGIEIFGQLA